MTKMTIEEIEAKASDLSTRLNCEVKPIMFNDKKTGEQIVGFLKEIDDYNVLIFAVDKYMSNNTVEGCEAILRHCLIKEESSPRILSDDKKDIKVKVGAVLACVPLIQFYSNEFKKK